MREIIKEPNNFLHKRCEIVTDFYEARHIADELLIVLKALSKWWNRWLGFAANQIGYNKRIIVLRTGRDKYEVLVNPSYVHKRLPFPFLETCYSLPRNHVYMVKRYLWSKVKYQDLEGNWRERLIIGPTAFYQEMDHIDGVLISEIGWRLL